MRLTSTRAVASSEVLMNSKPRKATRGTSLSSGPAFAPPPAMMARKIPNAAFMAEGHSRAMRVLRGARHARDSRALRPLLRLLRLQDDGAVEREISRARIAVMEAALDSLDGDRSRAATMMACDAR